MIERNLRKTFLQCWIFSLSWEIEAVSIVDPQLAFFRLAKHKRIESKCYRLVL